MLQNVRHILEKALFRRGFTSPAVRRILSLQIMVTLVSVVFGLATLHVSAWPASFSAGAFIITCNLWWLAKTTQWCLQREYSKGLATIQFLLFVCRFFILGLVLVAMIAWLHAPVIPLLAGLSTVLISLLAWGFTRATGHTFKEA